MVQRQAAIIGVDGNKASIEAAFLDGDIGAALTFQRQGIDILTGKSFERGDQVAAHALVGLRDQLAQGQVAGIDEGAVGQSCAVRHRFHAAGHHQILLAGQDAHGREIDGGEA